MNVGTATTTSPDQGWVSKKDAAAFLHCKERWIDELRKTLPPDKVRRVGQQVQIELLALARAQFDRQSAATKRRRRGTDDDGIEDLDDEDGPPSEALERLRTAKAELAELELAKKRGVLIEVSDLRSALLAMTDSGRILSTRLAKVRSGKEAHALFQAWLRSAADAVAAAADA